MKDIRHMQQLLSSDSGMSFSYDMQSKLIADATEVAAILGIHSLVQDCWIPSEWIERMKREVLKKHGLDNNIDEAVFEMDALATQKLKNAVSNIDRVRINCEVDGTKKLIRCVSNYFCMHADIEYVRQTFKTPQQKQIRVRVVKSIKLTPKYENLIARYRLKCPRCLKHVRVKDWASHSC